MYPYICPSHCLRVCLPVCVCVRVPSYPKLLVESLIPDARECVHKMCDFAKGSCASGLWIIRFVYHIGRVLFMNRSIFGTKRPASVCGIMDISFSLSQFIKCVTFWGKRMQCAHSMHCFFHLSQTNITIFSDYRFLTFLLNHLIWSNYMSFTYHTIIKHISYTYQTHIIESIVSCSSSWGLG